MPEEVFENTLNETDVIAFMKKAFTKNYTVEDVRQNTKKIFKSVAFILNRCQSDEHIELFDSCIRMCRYSFLYCSGKYKNYVKNNSDDCELEIYTLSAILYNTIALIDLMKLYSKAHINEDNKSKYTHSISDASNAIQKNYETIEKICNYPKDPEQKKISMSVFDKISDSIVDNLAKEIVN